MKIFLTGATGNIGRHLVRKLAEDNKVVALFRDEKKTFKCKNVEWLFGDVMCLRDEVIEKMNESDIVIHLAGKLGMFEKDCQKINIEGTRNILESLNMDRIHKFIFFSSIDAFGTTGKEVVTEKDEEHPFSIYGVSKLETEREIQKFSKVHQNLDYLILRLGNVIDDRSESMLSVLESMSKAIGVQGKLIRALFGKYELNVIDIKKVESVIEEIVKMPVLGNRVRFMADTPVSINSLSKNKDWGFAGDFIMGILRGLMRRTRKGGIYYYLCAGGAKRPCRRYSEKLYQELKVKWM